MPWHQGPEGSSINVQRKYEAGVWIKMGGGSMHLLYPVLLAVQRLLPRSLASLHANDKPSPTPGSGVSAA